MITIYVRTTGRTCTRYTPYPKTQRHTPACPSCCMRCAATRMRCGALRCAALTCLSQTQSVDDFLSPSSCSSSSPPPLPPRQTKGKKKTPEAPFSEPTAPRPSRPADPIVFQSLSLERHVLCNCYLRTPHMLLMLRCTIDMQLRSVCKSTKATRYGCACSPFRGWYSLP